MAIHFKKIRWQNLLSTGNQWTEVQLDKSDTTLIVGENGAGKSTLLDAVIFSLYGRPYRNVSKNLLVNSITNKNTMVEIEFVVRNKNYLVRRGIKPNVFEIYKDDTLVEQHASVKEYQDYLEKSVIGMNQKSFTQIVVVGSANFTPFMQLKPIERRAVIEDLLDIEIFTKMFMILKGKMSINRDQLIEFKHNIEMVKQKIDFTKKHINDIMSIKNSDLDSKKEKLSKLVEYMEELIDTNKTLNEEIQALSATITDEDKISSTLKKLSKYEIQMNSKIDRLNTEIKFLKDNDVCTTCGQDIDASFKDSNINQINDNIVEIETGLNQLTEELEKCNSRMMEISSVQKDISTRQMSIMSNESLKSSTTKSMKELKSSIEQDEVSLDTEEHTNTLMALNAELKQTEVNYNKQLELKKVYDLASALLKDGGIKTKIIKQYVPIINKLMNKYLATMDFFVQFELDENFNEQIKSRYRDVFTYESFSEGEKMRIDLSLLFTWRAVAKLRNSASTNLLILDEVFDSSLDGNGTDEFLKIITQLTDNTNVFVISHKGDQLFDKFHSVIQFQKVKNFSQMVK